MTSTSRRWVKIWHEILSDPDFQNLDLEQQARYYHLIVSTSAHGQKGRLTIDRPARQFSHLMHCDTFDTLKLAIKGVANTMKNLSFIDSKCNDKFSVTFQKWHKYQVDSSAERVARFREKVTVQEKEEDKEERVKKKNKDKESITTIAQNDKIVFDWSNFKFRNMNGKVELFQEKFPAVDITQELLKMEAWLMANPKNRKSNYEKFIANWLCRTQDKAKAIPKEETEDEEIARKAEEMRRRMKRNEDNRRSIHEADENG